MSLTDFILHNLQTDPVGKALPIFLVILVIEFLVTFRNRADYYKGLDTAASLFMGFVTLFIGLAMKFLAFLAFTALHRFAIFPEFLSMSHWWSWVLLFVLDDLTFYWHHRLSHEIRVLWAAHVNHHSSEYMNYGTALRQSWTEQIYKYVFWLYLPVLGFDPMAILIMVSINLIYQFLPHTELIGKLPRPIEFIFNTPSHHRVHHASNIRYLDRNHGGILIIWDRLFGTFAEERADEPPVYGITENIRTYNPLRIAFHEFADIAHDVRRAPTLADKLRYIFLAPGWSHDGPDRRADTLRQQTERPDA